MSDWDLLLTDAKIATMREGDDEYGVIEDGAVALRGGEIAWVGEASALPQRSATETRSCESMWLTPALIDCHTHLVFGGDRAAEFEQRLKGVSYEAIARSGGGILSTVRATREASSDQLFDAALPRLISIRNSGAATVEIKSGYGLDIETEIRMLEVARRLGESTGVSVSNTLLAAHALPPEFKQSPDDYIDLVCNQLIPAVADRKLADAIDAYLENIAFNEKQVRRVFDAAIDHGLRVKLHADQLTDGGGASLAAEYGALSADHLEFTTARGVGKMAEKDTVAVLLPGAFVTLGETQRPPVEAMRQHKLPIAIATDCNPGTSPLASVREAMALACRLFQLTPAECLAGATRHAARALGLNDRGTIAEGKRADLALWNISHPRDLSYWLGSQPLAGLFIQGHGVSLT